MSGGRRGWTAWATVAASVALLAPVPATAQGPDHAWCPEPEARQFDFWLGEWDVANRNSPPNSETWFETGTATNRVYTVVGGCAVVEHWRGHAFPSAGHIAGFSLRTWDPEASEWDLALLWPVGGPPRFGNPKGHFTDGVGDFYNRWVAQNGDTVVSRLHFQDISDDSFEWRNGLSYDGGETWSSSWIMETTRRPEGASGLWNGVTYSTARCPAEAYRAFDDLVGEWQGTRVTAAGDSLGVRAAAVPILDGCAVMRQTERHDGAAESFAVLAWEPHREGWTAYATSSDRRGLQRREGGAEGGGLLLTDVEPANGTFLRTRWLVEEEAIVEVRERSSAPDGPWTEVDRTRWTSVPEAAVGG